MLKIRLLGKPTGWSVGRVIFDPMIPVEACDGMLCWGACREEFLRYRGPRAWYFDEPRRFSIRRAIQFRQALRNLDGRDFLHHSNSDAKFRTPCVTHYGPMSIAAPHRSKRGTVAVVSNFGGRLWFLKTEARLRNRFILHDSVELYGHSVSWKRFRSSPWAKPSVPRNYRGEWPSNWYDKDHIDAMAKYKVAVCFENSNEPFYFTEKFVNAARAGCVPVYHAHPSVRDSVLTGAKWIDPVDYSFDVSTTLAAARECDSKSIIEQNYEWLYSEAVSETEGNRVRSRIAAFFLERCQLGTRTVDGRSPPIVSQR